MSQDPVKASKEAMAEVERENGSGSPASGKVVRGSVGGASKNGNGVPTREQSAKRERSTTLMRGSRAVRNTVQVSDQGAAAAELTSKFSGV